MSTSTPARTSGRPSPGLGILAWLRLLRIPNYFTVPGDVLAGFALAGGSLGRGPLPVWAMVLSLCLYAFGILLNDLADLEEDRRDRPARPLPSGAVPIGQARWATAGLLVLASILVATVTRPLLLPATGLLVTICVYDLWLKRIPFLGEFCIAGCRLLNVMVGALVIAPIPMPRAVTVGGAVVFIYVFGLALLARNETRSGVASLVGKLVRGLILLQALLIAIAGAYLLGLAVAALWIPATWLGRRFYSS